ncbi:MAG: HgcAB-associated protein HgcC [Candidatus Aminicenantales bacterium]
MATKNKHTAFNSSSGKDLGCCRVESLVSIDERGQMVLPKEIREKAEICPGDKLVLLLWETDEKVCCISLIKADYLDQMVKDLLSPMMKDIASK